MGLLGHRRDDAEFAEFATAAQGSLRRTAYLVCGDWDLASDLVQEALVRVYVAWPRIDRQGGLHAYARRCVVNLAIDHGRRRSSRERPTEHAAMDRASGTDDHGIPAREALVSALRELPPRQRACVALRFLEDLSVTETARALGCSEGTVKSQTSRALATLRLHPDLQEVHA